MKPADATKRPHERPRPPLPHAPNPLHALPCSAIGWRGLATGRVGDAVRWREGSGEGSEH